MATLVLLGERPEDPKFDELSDPGMPPLAPLDTKEAVGAVSEEGNFAGFVGDFGFGFTNPVPDCKEVCTGIGFLP